MSNFERDVANTMLDAADSRTAHEKTRIRQLEDAAAHWEHKYANARQYNRNLEERIAALEARCATLTAEVMHYTAGTAHPRVVELEAALREAMEWDWLTDPDSIPKEIYSRLSNMLLMDRFALETGAKS